MRARLVLDMALDRVESALSDDTKEVSLANLASTVGALGKIAGVQSTDVNVGGSVAHLHLDALRAPKANPMLRNEIAPIMLPDISSTVEERDTE